MATPQVAGEADAEKAVKDSLRGLLQAIEATAGASGTASPELAEAMRRVEQATMGLGDGAPAQLRHFLERRSYEKALAFLEQRAAGERPGGPDHAS